MRISNDRVKSLLESWGTRLTATLNLCLIDITITWALATLLQHMHKKFEINRTTIKGGCQFGRKVVTQDSKSGFPLVGAGDYSTRPTTVAFIGTPST